MAVAKYGQERVVAVTNRWLYSEHTDGRKLPAESDNFAAGVEFGELVTATALMWQVC